MDPRAASLAQISFLVANLNKRNYKTSVGEIQTLVEKCSPHGEAHLLRCLFTHVDFSIDAKAGGADFHQAQLLIQECAALTSKPNFATLICSALRDPEQKCLRPSPNLFQHLSRVLKLSRVQEVVIGLGLLRSADPEMESQAALFLRSKLPDLLILYSDSDMAGSQEGGFNDLPVEVLHTLLWHITYQPMEVTGLTPTHTATFIDALRREFPHDRVPVVLAPWLYPDGEGQKQAPQAVSIPPGVGSFDLDRIMQEAGYSSAASVQDCCDVLRQVCGDELKPEGVASCLAVMVRTHSGLRDDVPLQPLIGGSGLWEKEKLAELSTWNIDVFVEAVRLMFPQMDWAEVMNQLDQPEFIVMDVTGFHMILSAFKQSCPGQQFPVGAFLRPWKNSSGQLTLLQQALSSQSDFSFADYPLRKAAYEHLKVQPDEDERTVMCWTCLELIQALLHLSEVGHFEAVSTVFQTGPVVSCPDILLLSMLQARPTNWCLLQTELFMLLVPMFLATHANSSIVLHYTWNAQAPGNSIHQLMMNAMAKWYEAGDRFDQMRLSRILDVAQDLKGLLMLVNSTMMPFVVDLAALASRRGYLKLDKWLHDRMRDHQETFVQGCLSYIRQRTTIHGPANASAAVDKPGSLPLDTITTMLACLQTFSGPMSTETQESLLQLLQLFGPIPPKPRSAPGSGGGVVRSLPSVPLPTPGKTGMSSFDNPLSGQAVGGSSLLRPPGGSSTDLTDTGPKLGVSSNGGFSSGLGGFLTGGSSASTFGQLTDMPGSLAPGGPAQSAFGMVGLGSSSLPSFGGMNDSVSGSGGDGFAAVMGMVSNQQKPRTTLSFGTTNASSSSAGGMLPPLSNSAALPAVQPIAQSVGSSNSATALSSASTNSSDFLRKVPGFEQAFSSEVEEEANDNFKRLYNRVITIENVLDMLRVFKDSADPKQKDVFQCMLRNLFEEYKFFNSYPDKELHITGLLFGGLIEHNLVTFMPLGIALRYVLEALRKSFGSKLYMFGIAALDRFKHRLKEYPQYCQHLTSIPHFSEFPAAIAEFVTAGREGKDPPNQKGDVVRAPGLYGARSIGSSFLPSQRGFGESKSDLLRSSSPTPSVPSAIATSTAASTAVASAIRERGDGPSIAGTTNIDTLLTGTDGNGDQPEPSEAVQDRVSFIFNNLSQSNIVSKVDDFRETIQAEHLHWVAQYLVMKRVSIEPNFHDLYINFLFGMNNSNFVELVLNETYRNIKILLCSDKEAANFSDRTLLKNLGHWLGLLTLARNRPILHRDLALKELLLEAYKRGLSDLLYVVPFVSKVLESCSESLVFQPPSPWLMAILGVLCELHELSDLKLNLKFEVEVLCKHLKVDMKNVKTYGLLKDTERLNNIKEQLVTLKEKASVLGGNVPPPMPSFHYSDINCSTVVASLSLVQVNQQIPLLQANPMLKQCVRQAVERAVNDLMHPVVERSIKLAMTTTDLVVRKDFALDSDEQQLRTAAHHMVRNLTAGMVMITCREPLGVSIATNLRNNISSVLNIRNWNNAPEQQRQLIESACQQVANDNVELACAIIQKTAVEKFIPDMDKRLAEEIEIRSQARTQGRCYYNEQAAAYQSAHMPDAIRIKIGVISPQQMSVYEEFGRCLPGFLPSPSLPLPSTSVATDDAGRLLEKCAAEIENHIRAVVITQQSSFHCRQMQSLCDTVKPVARFRDNTAALLLLQKAVDGLLEGLLQIPQDQDLAVHFRDSHLVVLRTLQDQRLYGVSWVVKNTTRILLETREEVRYNLDAVDLLIRSQLINFRELDVFLTKAMDSGSYTALMFSMRLLRHFFVDCKHDNPLTESDVASIFEMLVQVAGTRHPPEGLMPLLEHVNSSGVRGGEDVVVPGVGLPPTGGEVLDKAPGGPSTTVVSSGLEVNEASLHKGDDPPGMSDKVEYLLTEWVRLHHQGSLPTKDLDRMHETYLQRLRSQGMLKTDEIITRFFRISTELCVELCYRNLQMEVPGQQTMLSRAKCYHTMDAFVKLAVVFIKLAGDPSSVATRMALLTKILQTVAWVLMKDQDSRQTEFHQLPYHRFFSMLLLELSMSGPVFDNITFPAMQTFCNIFHSVRPQRVPGFAYAWLELISHRVMINKLLTASHQKGWGLFQQLLLDMLRFMAPFLRNAELPKPLQQLYKGLLRVLLVLLHDFPEFLCDYHFSFCDVVPPNCIQMRNLILSAFPRNMRLPDPFTPNLKVDQLGDITQPPRILTNYVLTIQSVGLKQELDNYLKARSSSTFLADLRSHLQTPDENSRHYHVPLLNAVVLYVGTQAITVIQGKSVTISTQSVSATTHMDIFQNLANDLDTEGRYLFLNAIANQLRYPNSHTHYFSCALLHLFAEATSEAVQEQITRVLLERLIVNRPHPWGLLITFIELIKNQQYEFWHHQFVHCAPEIEKLFESVARSCIQQKQPVREMADGHE